MRLCMCPRISPQVDSQSWVRWTPRLWSCHLGISPRWAALHGWPLQTSSYTLRASRFFSPPCLGVSRLRKIAHIMLNIRRYAERQTFNCGSFRAPCTPGICFYWNLLGSGVEAAVEHTKFIYHWLRLNAPLIITNGRYGVYKSSCAAGASTNLCSRDKKTKSADGLFTWNTLGIIVK